MSTRLVCDDPDADGLCEGVDNCPQQFNPDQHDEDLDDRGDACDDCPLDPANDTDGDAVCGDIDTCPTIPNPDQDPEVCHQAAVNIEADLRGPDGRGSGVVRWRTTHEVSLIGFHVVLIDPAGHRTRLNPEMIPRTSCDTGQGQDYSVVVPRHRGGRHLFIEGVCSEECGPWGPAESVYPPARR